MGSKDTTPLFDALVSKPSDSGIKLPVPPVVATQVIGMASNENTDRCELSELVRKHQALAGHVLKIANYALFPGNTAKVPLPSEATSMISYLEFIPMDSVMQLDVI